MILSDRLLKNYVILDENERKQAKEWWIKANWKSIDKMGDKIIIDPFKLENIGPCCYDLSVGDEYVSLRDPYNIKTLSNGETININPSETILILTEEYLCLPRTIMGNVVPRARWIFEGTTINSSRIDPTWYGKLLIGFTNHGKDIIVLSKGDKFCTCYFTKCGSVEKYLTKKDIYFLGRTKIVKVEFSHVRSHKPLPTYKVCRDDLENVVDTYGPPFDIIRGVIELSSSETKEFIARDIAIDITRRATDEAIRKAYSSQTRLMCILISGILGAIFAFLIKFLFFMP